MYWEWMPKFRGEEVILTVWVAHDHLKVVEFFNNENEDLLPSITDKDLDDLWQMWNDTQKYRGMIGRQLR